MGVGNAPLAISSWASPSLGQLGLHQLLWRERDSSPELTHGTSDCHSPRVVTSPLQGTWFGPTTTGARGCPECQSVLRQTCEAESLPHSLGDYCNGQSHVDVVLLGMTMLLPRPFQSESLWCEKWWHPGPHSHSLLHLFFQSELIACWQTTWRMIHPPQKRLYRNRAWFMIQGGKWKCHCELSISHQGTQV